MLYVLSKIAYQLILNVLNVKKLCKNGPTRFIYVKIVVRLKKKSHLSFFCKFPKYFAQDLDLHC